MAGISSGPVALSILRLDKRALTSSDETEMNSRLLWMEIEGEQLREIGESGRKFEAK